MRRAFEFDGLACPRWGGRLRLIATIEDPQGIRRLLAHRGHPTEGPRPGPPRPPPVRAADSFCEIHA